MKPLPPRKQPYGKFRRNPFSSENKMDAFDTIRRFLTGYKYEDLIKQWPAMPKGYYQVMELKTKIHLNKVRKYQRIIKFSQ